MGIASISGASQIVATTADNPGHAVATAAGASAALRPSSPTPEAASPRDDVTQQPKPPRFSVAEPAVARARAGGPKEAGVPVGPCARRDARPLGLKSRPIP